VEVSSDFLIKAKREKEVETFGAKNVLNFYFFVANARNISQ
jgi:hypothetical protein